MLTHTRLAASFVKTVPEKLEPGILYVSTEYGTVIHSCCCGCGSEVVTPLGPTEWEITYDGISISLWPSVGNWNLPCRSHYIIRKGKVLDAGSWSSARIKGASEEQSATRSQYYAELQKPSDLDDFFQVAPQPAAADTARNQRLARHADASPRGWVGEIWNRITTWR